MAHLTLSLTETITVGDGTKKGIGKAVTEYVTITETYNKKLSRHFTERIRVADVMRRSANAIMHDLVIRDDVLDKDDLDNIFDSPPVGYEPFSILYPGDYRYEKAITGIRVQGGTGIGRAGVDGLKLNVDTPDVSDSGTASVTDDVGGTFIPFNRTFSVAPSGSDGIVQAQFSTGATFALPEILSVTKTGFTVILRDVSSPSTLVAGAITWAAKSR